MVIFGCSLSADVINTFETSLLTLCVQPVGLSNEGSIPWVRCRIGFTTGKTGHFTNGRFTEKSDWIPLDGSFRTVVGKLLALNPVDLLSAPIIRAKYAV
jgi:hypothetical protein